jgi:2-polyprenyl-3-methyl-5-hydroxy-6-metoxy-1,4-benzoquinol methylase
MDHHRPTKTPPMPATSQMEWRQGDILAEDSKLGRVDAVVSNAVLHHIPDTRAALRRLRALAEPGGTLGIVTFARAD